MALSNNSPTIFLCYASPDEPKARELYQHLANAGFDPWMGSKDILPGESWDRSIKAAIRKSDFFLALLSEDSVNRRGYVQVEIKMALDIWFELSEVDIYFIPVRLEPCRVPDRLASFQWVDLFEPDGFERLKKALTAGTERLGIIQEHFEVLKKGVDVWNKWRTNNPDIVPDLFNKDLSDMSLANIDFSSTILSKTDLSDADLSGADLKSANLKVADLRNTNLSRSDLRNADLTAAILIDTNLEFADLSNCKIYGVSAWDLNLNNATQKNLVLSRDGEPVITVDNLEVAQFIYLLIRNEKIRAIIDTITSKVVLILGRFTPERKVILDVLREELRRKDYLPILFDFDVPSSRNLTETVSTLAHMARFVIADITDAKSIPQELQRIIPDLPSLPVQPLILSSQYEYAMFRDFLDYHSVLMPYRYEGLEELLASLEEKVIAPAIAKANEIEERRRAIEKEIANPTLAKELHSVQDELRTSSQKGFELVQAKPRDIRHAPDTELKGKTTSLISGQILNRAEEMTPPQEPQQAKAGHLVDTIECPQMPRDWVIYRVPRNQIQFGTQLVVNESRLAVIYRNGQPIKTFGPGNHILDPKILCPSSNFFKLIRNWFLDVKKSQKTFLAEIYFVATSKFLREAWGTPNPIVLEEKGQEKELVKIGGHGYFSFRIGDPEQVIENFYSHHARETIVLGDIKVHLINIITQAAGEWVAEVGPESFIKLQAMTSQMEKGIKLKAETKFSEVGLNLLDVTVGGLVIIGR